MPHQEFSKEDAERKLILFLSIGTVVLMLILLYATYTKITGYYQGVQEIRRYNRQKIALDGIMGSLRDAETGLRGYMLSGDEVFLQPFTTSRSTYVRSYMAADSSFSAQERPALDSLNRMALRVQARFDERLAQLKGPGSDRALTHAELLEDKRLMDRTRALLKNMSQDVIEKRNLWLNEEKKDGYDAPGFVVVFTAMAVVAMTLLFWRLSWALKRTERAKFAIGLKAMELDEEVRMRTHLQTELQNILDVSPSGIMSFRSIRDESGEIIDFEWLSSNRRANAMVGRTDLVGKRMLVEMPQSRTSGSFRTYAEVVRSGIPAQREFYYQGPVGDFWMADHAVKLGDGFLVLFDDISDRKRIEENRLEADRVAMTGQLMRTVAHEIRNPLTNIHLALEQLQEEMTVPAEATATYFGIMERNLQRIGTLIKDMLESSRKRELQLSIASMEEVIESVLQTVKDRLALKGMVAAVDMEPGIPLMELDTQLMVLALTNIAVNAIEAMEPGKGVLRIGVRGSNESVHLTISDNGKGIGPDELKRLFEPFYSGRPGGLGLGLTATRSILHSHGISMDVESTLGQGTSFTILFPAVLFRR